MFSIFDHPYAFPIAFVLLFVALATFLPIRRWRLRLPVYAAAGAIALVVYIGLRPGDSSVSTASEADAMLAAGQPVFVEFFSNSCPACLASKPLVESLKGEFGEEVAFMQLNVLDEAAAPLMQRYGVYSTPTFLGFDADGELVFRQAGIIDRDKARSAMLPEA